MPKLERIEEIEEGEHMRAEGESEKCSIAERSDWISSELSSESSSSIVSRAVKVLKAAAFDWFLLKETFLED